MGKATFKILFWNSNFVFISTHASDYSSPSPQQISIIGKNWDFYWTDAAFKRALPWVTDVGVYTHWASHGTLQKLLAALEKCSTLRMFKNINYDWFFLIILQNEKWHARRQTRSLPD